MSSIFIRNAHTVVTMDAGRREIEGASVMIENGAITEVGRDLPVPQDAQVIEGHLDF